MIHDSRVQMVVCAPGFFILYVFIPPQLASDEVAVQQRRLLGPISGEALQKDSVWSYGTEARRHLLARWGGLAGKLGSSTFSNVIRMFSHKPRDCVLQQMFAASAPVSATESV